MDQYKTRQDKLLFEYAVNLNIRVSEKVRKRFWFQKFQNFVFVCIMLCTPRLHHVMVIYVLHRLSGAPEEAISGKAFVLINNARYLVPPLD